MEKIEVNTIEELKNARKNKVDEIVVTSDLIDMVKKESVMKKLFYWIIIIFLLLGFNFGISSKIIDFYSIFQLKSIGLTRTVSILMVLFIDLLIVIFGLMKSKISRYNLSYIDKLYKEKENISLIKVWYF
jgi:preprotein translocase subunit SecG